VYNRLCYDGSVVFGAETAMQVSQKISQNSPVLAGFLVPSEDVARKQNGNDLILADERVLIILVKWLIRQVVFIFIFLFHLCAGPQYQHSTFHIHVSFRK
jgi:hypothetical protein